MLEREKKKNFLRWMMTGCALISFGFIAWNVVSSMNQGGTIPFDEAIRHWIYEQRSPLLNGIFIPVTYAGNWQTITLLAAVLILIPATRRKIGFPFAVISLSSTVIYKLVKGIFQRPRPELDVRLIPQGGKTSYAHVSVFL